MKGKFEIQLVSWVDAQGNKRVALVGKKMAKNV